MSRSQKLLLSMLGSVLLHCLLAVMLLSGVLLPSMRATGDAETAAEPEEVVVLLSDILPEGLDGDREKMFVRTDPDSESAEAPPDPKFESDRNTLAATELPPEPDPDSIGAMPTIQGRVDFPGLELRDRDFTDGDGDGIELPAPGSLAASVPESSSGQPAADSMMPGGGDQNPSENSGEPNGKDGSGDAKGAVESSVLAEELQRTGREADQRFSEELAADTTRNPLEGNVPVVVPVAEDLEDRELKAEKSAPTALVGSPAGPESAKAKTESDALPGPDATGERSASDSGGESSPSSAMAANSSQASGEAPAFDPETRTNHVSGRLSNLGDKASVDAEGTELGRYKQGVVTAIEKSWHRFRLSNRDDITAGNLRLRFRVDSKGQVRNLKILRDEANIGMTEFTLKAILAADIPAMPADVAGLLGSDGLVMNYTVMVVY